MKILWAPWRIKYIEGFKKGYECIFCIKSKDKNDKKNFILKRGKYSFVIMNIFPYNPGHLMVAPYKHVPELGDLNKEEIYEIMELVKESIEVLKKVYSPHGFNIGVNIGKIAGAGFEEHIHFHIVPRWEGDTNFMPVLGNTKIISEELKRSYRRLKKYYVK
ncbi:MAG: HIT domain-containing protein [candidate division WOR-3 bacterium]